MIDPFGNDPHDIGADPTHFPADKYLELALLGKILLDQSLEGLEALRPEDFYFGRHGEVFGKMRRLWDDGIELDPYLITDRDTELFSVLLEAQSTPEPLTPASSYARKVRDLAQKRRILPLLSKAAGMSMNGVSYEQVRQHLLTELDSDERRSERDTWQLRKASGLVDPPQPREWLLEGLIFRGQISMWYGPPGIRKSLLLMDACVAMATGQNWLMRRPWQQDNGTLATFHATRKARVLWLDYDNGEFETEVRVRAALSARGGLDDAEFYYMSETTPWLALDNASHVRRVIRLALDVGADVIVFDALGMVLGDVDENAPDVARVIAKLKEIRAATGAAILAVHHPSKSGAQNDKATTYNAAGSAKFSNFFEWSIELRAGEEKGTILANVVKHRGWAKTTKFMAELEYRHFGEDRPELTHELKEFKFYPATIENAGEKRKATIKSVVLEILADSEMNQKDLIAATKTKVEASMGGKVGEFGIREEIKRMVEAGDIVGTQSGARQPTIYSLSSVDPVDRR